MDIDAKKIDVKSSFDRQDYPTQPTIQPIDYTAYAKGDAKVNANPPAVTHPVALRSLIGMGYPSKSAAGKKRGLIPQEGLAKREGDKISIQARTQNDVPLGKDRPTQNVGILSYADRFFKWLNGAIGG